MENLFFQIIFSTQLFFYNHAYLNTKILRFVTNDDGNYLFYVDTLIDATKMVESYIKGMKIDLTHSRSNIHILFLYNF